MTSRAINPAGLARPPNQLDRCPQDRRSQAARVLGVLGQGVLPCWWLERGGCGCGDPVCPAFESENALVGAVMIELRCRITQAFTPEAPASGTEVTGCGEELLP